MVLGGVTYISSSGIVAKVLDDFGRLGNSETPPVLSVLVIEDLAMAPYLPLLAVLLAGGSAWRGIGLAVAAVGLAVVALAVARRHGHVLTRRMPHPKSEVVLLTVMGLLLLAGGAAELLSVSSAVVAFLVGLSISGSLADRARELLSPLRDVFAAFFFVLFGIQIDVGAIPQRARRGRGAAGRHRGHQDADGLDRRAPDERRGRPPARRHGAGGPRRVLHRHRRASASPPASSRRSPRWRPRTCSSPPSAARC